MLEHLSSNTIRSPRRAARAEHAAPPQRPSPSWVPLPLPPLESTLRQGFFPQSSPSPSSLRGELSRSRSEIAGGGGKARERRRPAAARPATRAEHAVVGLRHDGGTQPVARAERAVAGLRRAVTDGATGGRGSTRGGSRALVPGGGARPGAQRSSRGDRPRATGGRASASGGRTCGPRQPIRYFCYRGMVRVDNHSNSAQIEGYGWTARKEGGQHRESSIWYRFLDSVEKSLGLILAGCA